MAVNTRNRRASAIGIGFAALLVLPAPDATVDQGDRQQAAVCYRGISSALVVTASPVALHLAMLGVQTVDLAMAGASSIDLELLGAQRVDLTFAALDKETA